MTEAENEERVAERLQTVRDRLFRLKGYLERTGYPAEALAWVEEAIEAVTILQTMGE